LESLGASPALIGDGLIAMARVSNLHGAFPQEKMDATTLGTAGSGEMQVERDRRAE